MMLKTQFRGGVLLVKIHVVQQGDTLWKIAQQYGVDFEKLKQANSHLTNPDQLTPGQKIKIPQGPHHAKKQYGGGGTQAKEKPIKEGLEVKPKEEPKKEETVPPVKGKVAGKEKEEHELLKALIKKAAPYVITKLLKDEKPEVINQIKIELDMANVNQQSYKPIPPAPMPYLYHHKPLSPYPYHPPVFHHLPHKEEAKKEKPMWPKGEDWGSKAKFPPPPPPAKEWWQESKKEPCPPPKKEAYYGPPPSSPCWSSYPYPSPPGPCHGQPYGLPPHGPFGHYYYPSGVPHHLHVPMPGQIHREIHSAEEEKEEEKD